MPTPGRIPAATINATPVASHETTSGNNRKRRALGLPGCGLAVGRLGTVTHHVLLLRAVDEAASSAAPLSWCRWRSPRPDSARVRSASCAHPGRTLTRARRTSSYRSYEPRARQIGRANHPVRMTPGIPETATFVPWSNNQAYSTESAQATMKPAGGNQPEAPYETSSNVGSTPRSPAPRRPAVRRS